MKSLRDFYWMRAVARLKLSGEQLYRLSLSSGFAAAFFILAG